MKSKWEFKDYAVVAVIVILALSFCYSCSRSAQKSHDEAIEAAYTEGYEQGYYDGENGNPYQDVR